MTFRDVLNRKFRKTKTTSDYEIYENQGNKVNNEIKKAKQSYHKNILTENSKDPAPFWKTSKRFFLTKKDQSKRFPV